MVTLFDMLALQFMIGIPAIVGLVTARHFGLWPGVGAGVLSAVPCVSATVLFYRAKAREVERLRRELRDKYRAVYRVIATPNEHHVRKPEGAEIRVGDYGWEAEAPTDAAGLIYLQGLSKEWQVVWYAGFQPDQVEMVGPKPRSQYDWNYSWVRNPPPCPFPVQDRDTVTMGLPDAHGWNGPKYKR